MKEPRIRYCQDCGNQESPDFRLSQRSLCIACAVERVEVQYRALRARRGPYYEEWLSRQIKGLERRARRGRVELRQLRAERDGSKVA